jgi:hypothetical protein
MSSPVPEPHSTDENPVFDGDVRKGDHKADDPEKTDGSIIELGGVVDPDLVCSLLLSNFQFSHTV